jgi:hypothetical protein
MTAITDDLPARLLHEEHEGWQAIIARRAGEYYGRTMTRDALLVVPGNVVPRTDVGAFFEGLAPLDSYELHDPAVIRINDRSGILVYRLVTRRGEESVESSAATTYVFLNGGWCLALHQQSPA